jgi:short-subunit dehydrogenase
MGAFSNQVAVITGASSGIGKSISLILAGNGATVCLVGRNLARLEEVARKIQTPASLVICREADLSLDNDIEDLVGNIFRDFKGVDILIHSAGSFSRGPVETSSLEVWDQQFRVNARAPYAITKALLPLLRICKGQIVFINSTVAFGNGRANLAQYIATKHALKVVADSLREEVNSDGIRVLSVYPGRTDTPMQAAIHKMEKKEYKAEKMMHPDNVAETVVAALSLSRRAEITDIIVRPMSKPE